MLLVWLRSCLWHTCKKRICHERAAQRVTCSRSVSDGISQLNRVCVYTFRVAKFLWHGKFMFNISKATKSWFQVEKIFKNWLFKNTNSEVFWVFTTRSLCLMTVYTECYLEHSLMNISVRSAVKYPKTCSMTQYANQLWDVRGLLGLTLHRFRLF